MQSRSLMGMFAIVVAAVALDGARAADTATYPSWKGQWIPILANVGGQAIRFDPSKPFGPGQQAPLTSEYQKVLADSMADQALGGLGNYPTARCLPGGMPRMMSYGRQEYVITPETTYILLGSEDHYRRIYTDGRDWPDDTMPTYAGYSIGRWIDTDGDGRYDLLEVETRGPFKGPRAYDATGLPLAFDNQSIFRERFFLDGADANVLHDVITVIDHALTRPWTVDKIYRRNDKARPQWIETYCTEDNANIMIGGQNYYLRADGILMPARKDQAPPDLRYFKQSQK